MKKTKKKYDEESDVLKNSKHESSLKHNDTVQFNGH